jgi:hypothetical protein
MASIFLYVLITVLSFISLGLLGWVYYLKYKAKYTREKYAFAALFAFIFLAGLGISSILYQTPWIAILKVVEHLTGISLVLETSKPVWSEQVLIFLFIGYIIWNIQRTFTNWNNKISVNHNNQKKRHDRVFFVQEGLNGLLRKHSEEQLKIYEPIDHSKHGCALEVPNDNLAWRIQAIELLTLHWHNYYQFLIENDEGWHARENCWIGKNVKEDKTTAVLCCRENPNSKQRQGFANYVNSLGINLIQCELIIITQDGDSERTHPLADDVLIHQYSEAWFLNNLVDFRDYFLDLKRRVKVDHLPDSDLVISDIYVPSKIKDDDNKKINKNLEDYLKQWLAEPGQRQLALLGEYGQGKSTGSLVFSYHLMQKFNGQPPRIPILLELRGKSPKTLQPLELLSIWAKDYRIDPKALMKLLQAGRLLLIFEGFDEMAEVSNAEARFSHFRSLWRFCYPKAKILITGRPNFFLDDQELKALLGVDVSTATGAYVQALYLQPFDQSQIANSLRAAPDTNRQEIIRMSEREKKFNDIVSRPSLLYIVNQLWNNPELKKEINSAGVIGLFIKHSYKRQTEKVRGGKEFMILSEAEREYFMDGIAVYMATKKLPNQITLPDFNDIVEKLYEVIPDDISAQGNALGSNTYKPLKIRLQDNEEPLEAVETDVRTYGVLVKDLTRTNALKFPHKSFLEFLFANYATKRLTNKDDASMSAIWATTYAEPKDLVNMLESLEFTGELLHLTKDRYKNKENLLKHLFDIVEGQNFITNIIPRKAKIISGIPSRHFKRIRISSLLLLIIMTIMMMKLLLLLSLLLSTVIIIMMMIIDIVIDIVIMRNKNKICLWFLLSIILGIKRKDIQDLYGKEISDNILPELAKKFNAGVFLDKYDYFSDD